MGYSQSSLAVLRKSPDAVLAALALRPTGQREDFPESPFVSTILPSGWFLVVAASAEHDIISESTMRHLSTDCEAVTCSVEEHVMVSEARGWRDGQLVWRVGHDSNRSIEDLQTEGELPPAFGAIRDRLSTQQRTAGGKKSDVDYIFDVPVELAKSFSNYRHDMDIPGIASDSFDVLESLRPPASNRGTPKKKSFLQRLFAK